MELNVDTITFGKYKNKTLKDMLKDRKYCKWFLDQSDFKTKYEYIYNKVKEFEPRIYFLPIKEIMDDEKTSFIDRYLYFNLTPVDKISINLTDNEKICYSFYLTTIDNLKNKILERIENKEENLYDIKAPVKWLQKFETETGLKRDEFKEFINSHELPNIPYIIEDIKKEGGIVYNGANSFMIAKKRSEEQEKYWEIFLKDIYGEDISIQYYYKRGENVCMFDFINISTNTLYECKLNIKDFNDGQYNKYLLTLGNFKILYLIDRDCVIDIDKKVLYTLDDIKYAYYRSQIPLLKNMNKFEEMIMNFDIIKIDIEEIKKYV